MSYFTDECYKEHFVDIYSPYQVITPFTHTVNHKYNNKITLLFLSQRFYTTGSHMQVFSSNVYFKIGIEEINSSQKEFFKDFIALVDLGDCFIIINENQSKILYSYTDPVNIFLCNSFIRIPKNITTKDLISCFKTTNYREKQCYKPESLTRDEIDVLRLSVSYSLKQISIIKGIEYKTVSYHKIRALHKLNIKSIVELFISLSEWGKHYENIKSCMLENRNAINKIH